MWLDLFYLLCSIICCSLIFHVLALLYFVPIWVVRLFFARECYATRFEVISYYCSFNRLILLYIIIVPYILPLLFDYRVTMLCIYKSILLSIYLWFTPSVIAVHWDCCSIVIAIAISSQPWLIVVIPKLRLLLLQRKSVACKIWFGLLCIYIWFQLMFNMS